MEFKENCLKIKTVTDFTKQKPEKAITVFPYHFRHRKSSIYLPGVGGAYLFPAEVVQEGGLKERRGSYNLQKSNVMQAACT